MNPKRILIADDNPVLIMALSNVLTAAGFEVLSVEDGAGAVREIRNQRPDLVLLDISFPPDVAHGGGVAWDGFRIMTWLGRMEEIKDIPIVIVSEGDPAHYKKRAIAAGAVAYFQKPVQPEELVAALKQILGEGTTPSEPSPEADPAGQTTGPV
jgi:CheY-like chemotaxis protein